MCDNNNDNNNNNDNEIPSTGEECEADDIDVMGAAKILVGATQLLSGQAGVIASNFRDDRENFQKRSNLLAEEGLLLCIEGAMSLVFLGCLAGDIREARKKAYNDRMELRRGESK